MEIVERRENHLLDRVELNFRWDHPKGPTPSRTEMIDAAAKSEPGADKSLVFVKNVNTRFGMSRTSGIALVYGSAESASIEPEHIVKRHRTSEGTENPPTTEESTTDDAEEESPTEQGGDE